MYIGSWDIDDAVTFAVNTHSTSGAESDADSAPTYRIYEDETGTPLLTGTMALLDDANTVGFYSEQITLSAANGFERGKSYTVRIRAVVGGTAGTTERTFQVAAKVDLRYSVGVAITNSDGTAQAGGATTITLAAAASSTNDLYKGRKITLVGGTGSGQSRWITGYVGSTRVATVHAAWTTNPDSSSQYVLEGAVYADLTHLGGDAQSLADLKDFADAGYDPATNKVQGVVLVDTVTTYTGNTPQTGDAFARLGAPAGASVSADLLVLDNLVDDLESRLGTPSNLGSGATIAFNLQDIEAQTDDIGAAGAGLTALPWNAAWDAEVQSEVQDALEANNLDHLVKLAVDTDWATTVHLGSVVGHLADNGTAATFDRATDSLEAIRDRGDAAWTSGGGLSQADVRAAVGLASANLDTQLSAIDDYLDTEMAAALAAVDTEVAAIKAKTDQLTFTTAGRVDCQVYGMQANSITASALATDAAQEVADTVLGRSVSATESTAAEHSLCSIILGMLESIVSGTTWTIKRTDGTTTHLTKTLTTASGTDPITGVS